MRGQGCWWRVRLSSATLFITGADEGRLLRNEWWNLTRNYLCRPQLAPAKPLNRHCMTSRKQSLPPRAKNGNGMTPDEPYLDIGGLLESGRGVRTPPPPDLRFRNLLKSATWQFRTCIHPALRQRTLPATNLELKFQVSLMESHPIKRESYSSQATLLYMCSVDIRLKILDERLPNFTHPLISHCRISPVTRKSGEPTHGWVNLLNIMCRDWKNPSESGLRYVLMARMA